MVKNGEILTFGYPIHDKNHSPFFTIATVPPRDFDFEEGRPSLAFESTNFLACDRQFYLTLIVNFKKSPGVDYHLILRPP